VFVIVGRAPFGEDVDRRAQYEAHARARGVADRVRFVGFHEDVRPAVADFDVLVLPSRQEPYGRSILEAMALGTPVVASRVGGVPEILSHGADALLVPPGDPAALAEALGSLLDDPARRRGLADRALQRVREGFDAAVVSRRVQDLLEEAARDQRRS
jgi:glycosyltransferase involved in cell wall biosynthesis